MCMEDGFAYLDSVVGRLAAPLVKWRVEQGFTQLVLPQPISLCGPHHQTGAYNMGETLVV